MPLLALAGLILVSTVARGIAALRVPSPWYVPDEQVYGLLGDSLIRHGRFEILGSTPDFFGLVYPAFVGVPLVLAGVETGYDLLKPLQAFVMSLTAVPVYLWGRSLMPPRYALIAAALTLCVPGLAYSGFLMTEVVFYPVLTLAAWAMARALARPSRATQTLMLLAIVAAVLTRLQALALVAALAFAVLLQLLFTRETLRSLRAFAPTAVSLAALAALWTAVATLRGGHVLGAYGVTSQYRASTADSARWVLYHAADLLLLTALVPVLAFGVLLWQAARGREVSRDVTALLAVTASLTLISVTQVGVFAATWIGRLAERNLLALAPLFFLAFSLWLARAAPRPRSAWVVFVAAFLLLGFVPWDELAADAAIPDSYSTVPFNELVDRSPETSLALTIPIAAFTLAVAWLLVPRRFAGLLAVLVGGLLIGASVVVTRVTTYQARVFQPIMIGTDKRWIDAAAAEPVAFLYAGEQAWSGGAPIWLHAFWNRRLERVYALYVQRIAGPMPLTAVRVEDDGRLLHLDGRAVSARYVATSSVWTVRGELSSSSDAGYRLWVAEPPVRLATRVVGARLIDLALGRRARLTVYDCRRDTVAISLYGLRDARIGLRTLGSRARTVVVRTGQTWSGRVQLRSLPERRLCQLEIVGGGVRLTWFAPQPPGS